MASTNVFPLLPDKLQFFPEIYPKIDMDFWRETFHQSSPEVSQRFLVEFSENMRIAVLVIRLVDLTQAYDNDIASWVQSYEG